MSDTHVCCNNRLKDEGGKATCCECNPHEGCNLGVEDKPKWEEEMDEVLEDTIIDGGFDYSKQDAWIDATEARKRIKAFLAKQKELSYKEGYEKATEHAEDKSGDWN